jgi:hypothetical protein
MGRRMARTEDQPEGRRTMHKSMGRRPTQHRREWDRPRTTLPHPDTQRGPKDTRTLPHPTQTHKHHPPKRDGPACPGPTCTHKKRAEEHEDLIHKQEDGRPSSTSSTTPTAGWAIHPLTLSTQSILYPQQWVGVLYQYFSAVESTALTLHGRVYGCTTQLLCAHTEHLTTLYPQSV